MPVQSKPIKHMMPKSDEQVQREVEERTGTRPCMWQIQVVRKVLEGDAVTTSESLQLQQPDLEKIHILWYYSISSMVLCSSSHRWSYWGSSLSMCLPRMVVYHKITYLHDSDTIFLIIIAVPLREPNKTKPSTDGEISKFATRAKQTSTATASFASRYRRLSKY